MPPDRLDETRQRSSIVPASRATTPSKTTEMCDELHYMASVDSVVVAFSDL